MQTGDMSITVVNQLVTVTIDQKDHQPKVGLIRKLLLEMTEAMNIRFIQQRGNKATKVISLNSNRRDTILI